MNFEIGKLYQCSNYFLLVFSSFEEILEIIVNQESMSVEIEKIKKASQLNLKKYIGSMSSIPQFKSINTPNKFIRYSFLAFETEEFAKECAEDLAYNQQYRISYLKLNETFLVVEEKQKKNHTFIKCLYGEKTGWFLYQGGIQYNEIKNLI